MKVNEVIMFAQEISDNPKAMAAEMQQQLENSIESSRLTSTMVLARSQDFQRYLLVIDGQAQGQLRLKGTEVIGGKSYDVIMNIYLLPAIRKTWAAGVFLLAVRNQLTRPLLLGTKNDHGGVMFAGGQDLVQALLKKKNMLVKLIDLDTGLTRPIGATVEIPNAANISLVFEHGNYPIVCDQGLGEIYVMEHAERSLLNQEFNN